MSASAELALLALGVFGLLVLLSLAGDLARARQGPGPSPALETYMARVSTWWAMAVLISLALLTGRGGIILLTAVASFAALREFLTLTTKDPADHLSLALAFYVALPLQYLFVLMKWPALYAIFLPVLAFLFLPLVSAVRGQPRRFLVRVAETQWGLMICVFCMSHLAALTMLDLTGYDDRSALLVAFLVLVVQLADLAEYLVSRRFGRRRLAPDLSPKTAEGALVGLLAAGLVGAVLAPITPFGPGEAMLLAVIAAAVGMGGNLVMAAIKADRGVRDWSHLIPGQGGVLDQLDSVIFAAPVFYYLVQLGWT